MKEEKTKEFDVLGYRVKLATSQEGASFSADDIVSLVKEQAELIHKKNPSLNRGQLATLVALKLAEDKMTIDREFRESVDQFQTTAQGALKQIEQIDQNTQSSQSAEFQELPAN